ncbi:MAG: hypothetical protein ACP5G0_05480 [Desulfomonilia bacterium]
MKHGMKAVLILFCILAVPMMLASVAAVPANAADEVTISGIVQEGGIIVAADNKAYTIVDKDAGKDVITMVGKKLEVKGAVAHEGDKQTITVASFKEIQ